MLALVLVIPGTTVRAGDSRHDDSSGRHVSALIAELRSPDPQTRRNAASALSRVKPLPPDAIPAVTQALKDSDSTVQAFAVRALANAGAAGIPALKALLEDEEPRNLYARREAIRDLSRMAQEEPATWPLLVGAFDDPNLQQWPVHLDAFSDPDHSGRPSIEVAKIGAPVVPMLRGALLDKNPVVRRAAVAALQMAPGAAKDATPELIATLKDSDPSVREIAAMDLGRIGAPARTALPALAAALSDPRVGDEAAVAMARIDPTDKAPVPTLIDALEHGGLSVQQMDSVRALAAMGSNARAAVPALEHLLAPDPYTRPRAEYVKALGSIEGVDAVPVLTQAMTEGKDAGVSLAAVKAIAAMGPGATVAIPGLVRALSNPNQEVREAAADTLAAFGDRAKPALLTALHSPDLYTREAAIRALGKAKPLPDDVAHALSAAAYGDKSANVRNEAANVLDKAGVKAERAQWSQVEQDSSEEMSESESPEPDTKRTYRRQEVLTDIPPDNNSEYPLQLIHLLTLNDGKMLAAVYRGRDHQSDRLIFWTECGNDCYRQMELDDAGEGIGGGTFDPLKEIFISGAQYVGVGENVWRNGWVDFFRIHGDEVQRAEIKPPEQWDRDKLLPGGEIANQSENGLFNVDTKRLYSRQEMFADIAPENNQGHPLRLVYLLSFYGDQMLAAVYRGAGHADRLIFWRQSGKDRYRQMRVIDAGPNQGGGTFDPPRETSLVSMNGYPGGWLVDVGVKVQRAHWDDLFREGDELRPVEIESPEEWYGYRLQPGEKIVGPSESWFFNGDGEARFSLQVRSGGRTKRVAGTYTLVEPSGVGGHVSFIYPGIARVESPESEQIWKLVPNSARIEPLRSH